MAFTLSLRIFPSHKGRTVLVKFGEGFPPVSGSKLRDVQEEEGKCGKENAISLWNCEWEHKNVNGMGGMNPEGKWSSEKEQAMTQATARTGQIYERLLL